MLKKIFCSSKEENFWKWFSKNSNSYLNFENNQEKLFDHLSAKLSSIDKNLTFEFSPVLKNNKREFIISADGIESSFISVEKLIEKAPALQDWIFIAFRQPKPDYDEINFDGITLRNDDVFFRYSKTQNKIGLELNIRNFVNTNKWIIITYLLLDNVIGEYDTQTFIDWIERKELNETEVENLYNINELPELLNDLKLEIFGR